MLDHGLRTVMELDQKSFYSFLAMETAVTRKDINGKVWGPQQRINRMQALYSYTRWSADYFLKEKVLGSIEPKKLADFVVLDRDFLTTPEDEIGQIDPVLTVVGGKIAYSQAKFAQSAGIPVLGFQKDRSFWLRGTPDDLTRKSDDSGDGSGALSGGG
jgi:predicted amidohydrolase YtcJ